MIFRKVTGHAAPKVDILRLCSKKKRPGWGASLLRMVGGLESAVREVHFVE